MNKSRYHSTQNLYEAAYLYAKGFKLNDKEQFGAKKTIFLEGENIHQEAMNYYNGGIIEAKKFTDAYRTVKDFALEQ